MCCNLILQKEMAKFNQLEQKRLEIEIKKMREEQEEKEREMLRKL